MQKKSMEQHSNRAPCMAVCARIFPLVTHLSKKPIFKKIKKGRRSFEDTYLIKKIMQISNPSRSAIDLNGFGDVHVIRKAGNAEGTTACEPMRVALGISVTKKTWDSPSLPAHRIRKTAVTAGTDK